MPQTSRADSNPLLDFCLVSFYQGPRGRFRRAAYEMGVLSTLRDRLRSGDVFVKDSKKFADLDSYLIPPADRERLQPEVCRQLGLPKVSTARIEERLKNLNHTFF